MGNRTVFLLNSSDTWRIDSFFIWYAMEELLIHNHHSTEELIVFPRLLQRMDGAKIPDRMTDDHATLLEALDKISDFGPQIKAASNSKLKAKIIKTLQESFHEMLTMMTPHLDAEEDVLIPLIAKHFTESSFNDLIGEILKRYSLLELFQELASFFAWFPSWCSPATGCPEDQFDNFKTLVPTPIVFLTNFIFLPRYEDALNHLKAIETGVEYHSPMVRINDLKLGAAALLLLLIIYKAASFIVCSLCCRRKPALKQKRN